MSFTNTPLGQQRRLDRDAFLNPNKKQLPKSDSQRGASTHTLPLSYSYGAPEVTQEALPHSSAENRLVSPSRQFTMGTDAPDDSRSTAEPADSRYTRLRQQNQSLGSTMSTSSNSSARAHDLRDTSVNVANAFTQAAFSKYGVAPKPKASSSWAAGSRLAPPSSNVTRRSASVLVEDENGEFNEGHSGDVDVNGDPIASRASRAKSPFFDVLQTAGSYVAQAAKRATSRQPEDSTSQVQQSLSSVDRTSDYEDAEAAYQRAKAGGAPSPVPNKPTKKKPRKSKDNAAYKPTGSESEESDGLDSDEGKRKKKLKQIKGMALPTIGPSKTARGFKKPRRQSSRPGASVLGEGDLRSVSSLVQVDEEPSVPPRGRTKSRSRSHTPRAASVGGQTTDSLAEEVGLDEALKEDDSNAYTDPEIQQQSHEIAASQQASRHTQSYSHSSIRGNKNAGIGAMLGTLVRQLMKIMRRYGTTNVMLFVGVFVAAWYGLSSYRGPSSPTSVPSREHHHTPLPTFDVAPSTLEELIERLAVLERAQRSTDTSIGEMGTRFGHIEGRVGTVDTRVGNVDSRVGSVEGRITNLDSRVAHVDDRTDKIDQRVERFDVRAEQADFRLEQFGGRVAKIDAFVGQIDSRVGQVDSRISQVDSKFEKLDTRFGDVDTRVEQLGTRVEQAGARPGKPIDVDARMKEFEARARDIDAKAKEIDGQAKRFEGRAQEIDAKSKEIESKSKDIEAKTKQLDTKSREHDSRSRDMESKLREIDARFKDLGGSWWSRTKTGHQADQLTIGSEAFEQVVQRAVLATTKDTLGRADYALYTGGARVVPEYTSDSLSIPAEGWRGRFGIGTIRGRSPAVALVPDINVGNCWAFGGNRGQLGVLLSRNVRVDSITIDHASRDVAYDVKTAPRKFVVLGLVEGADNLEKLARYQEQFQAPEIESGTETDLDLGASSFKASIKLAEFEYDINAASHIQTFAVPDDVRAAGIDVGLVVFKVLSSWGGPHFTCLYRVRVHGEPVDRV